MKSQWVELKETAIILRQGGQSLKTIHHNLGIPISTLSGWLKDVNLSETQLARLQQNKNEAWKRAHQKAADWHRTQKALRLLKAKQDARNTLSRLEVSHEILDLALAILLFGGGSRGENSPISSSDPVTLRFILAVLRQNYEVDLGAIRYDLSLRTDQDANSLKEFWSKQLAISPDQFKSINIDKRSSGKPTDNTYKGVCIISFSSVAVQRKLRYLYTLFCERIAEVNLGT